MARPRCSRNEPKMLRSRGGMVRQESRYTRAAVLAGAWANRDFPSMKVAEQPAVAVRVFCRKRRLGMSATLRIERLLVLENSCHVVNEKRFCLYSLIPRCESIRGVSCLKENCSADRARSRVRGRGDIAGRTRIVWLYRVERSCARGRFYLALPPLWRTCLRQETRKLRSRG